MLDSTASQPSNPAYRREGEFDVDVGGAEGRVEPQKQANPRDHAKTQNDYLNYTSSL